jgi:small-conductance mechanosensitive channel
MSPYYRIISAGLLALLILTIVGLVLTNRPVGSPRSGPSYRNAPFYRLAIVTQDQFDTARKLAARAVTREEQWMAREALRIADNEVDLAFATALQEAVEHPAPLTPEAQAISDRLKKAQAQMDFDQAEIDRLKKVLADAKESAKDALQQQLQLIQAQADLDQDEVDDAHQDLIRAGGDPQGIIQRMKQRYEAREQANGGLQNLVPSGPQNSIEETQARNIVALVRAWYSLQGKYEQLQQAERNARAQSADLNKSHEKLEQEAEKQKAQEPTPPAKAANAAQSGSAPAASNPPNSGAAKISSLKRRAANRKNIEVFDKRIEDEQQLADTYKRWSTFVKERERQFMHLLLYCVLWILVIALLTVLIDIWVSRSFARLMADRKQLHTLHSVGGYAIRAGGLILILLVIFGPPTQFAAVLALAGAGLTVALKDFIVAFIGWFVLMGRNGIRPGDWVEINGVSGEVLEIGPLRTILLETGNWSDAGHPTGRKVTFMNGFAVEGNYFNFSTSGQWMWDEIEFAVPADADPFAVAEAIKGIVASETQKNAQLATDEWQKVAPSAAPKAFHSEPVMSVRPTGSGVTVVIRYITRADERHEVRSRIYRAMIDLQRRKDMPQLEPGSAVR